MFNIGVEGSFIAGMFTAAVVGANVDIAGPIVILTAMAAASAAGAAVGWGPGWLKARLGVDEVVVTLMGNFVVAGVVGWRCSPTTSSPRGPATPPPRWSSPRRGCRRSEGRS